MEKKKIGIITFHRAINYGAVIQAYALMKYLQKKGVDVKVIDYYPKVFKKTHTHLPKKPKNFLIKLSIIHLFNAFIKRYLPLTRPYYTQKELINNPPAFDFYISGSDQIWNNKITKGESLPYFLSFVPKNKPRIAYAASTGGSPISGNEQLFKERLLTYQNISVRERVLQIELEKLLNTPIALVADPVFLLNKEDYFELIGNRTSQKAYIAIIDLDKSALLKECALSLQKQTGLPIINISGAAYNYTYNPLFISPVQWMNYIRNASYVITNSFHGLAMSILFEKNFFYISKMEEEKNNRALDLLQTLNLEENFVRISSQIDSNKNINYESTTNLIRTFRESSEKYLTTALGIKN